MHRLKSPVLLALVLVAVSCEWDSYDNWAMPEYSGLFNWEELTPKAEWSNRYDHAGAAFQGKLWIFGGYDPGRLTGDSYLEDVWSSEDGTRWEQVSENAPWKGRRGHSVNVFDDGNGEALFLAGGFEVDEATGKRQYCNDVWKSADGLSWEQIKPRTDAYWDTTLVDWDPRFNHACLNVQFGGIEYLYLVGGSAMRENYSALYSMKYYRDIWRSTDGIHWEEVVATDFGERSELSAFFDAENERLYLHGGTHSKLIETEYNDNHPVAHYNAVWYSDDGQQWQPDTSFLIDRAGHELFSYAGQFWLFPGKNTSYKKFHLAWGNTFHTYRREPDGLWILDSEGSAFNGRHSYARIILNDKVYILGGETGDMGPNNDVWVGTINN